MKMPPVLYLDNHLLVVMKPSGLLSQADETGDADVLTLGKAYLKEKFDKPGKVFLGLVHRLDRPASGVLMLARTSKSAARLSDQFRRRKVDKRYLAVVDGVRTGSGRCEDYLVKEDRQVRIVPPDHPGAAQALLTWEAVATADGQTLLSVVLLTGRPHQIRVQLAAGGTPILGDLRYGAKRPFGNRSIALHCTYLGIEHPTRKESLAWSAPPPEEWGSRFKTQIDALLADLTPQGGAGNDAG